MASVGIIGAGIAGLTAAYQLRQEGIQVAVFEAAEQVGGKMRSERIGGYLVECGPNTIQAATPLMNTLIDRLDVADAVVEADAAAKKRYVVRDGMPQPLPTSPIRFLTADLFSLSAKLRLLGEPFIAAADTDAEESVASFARRRLGREVLDYGLNPFVGGIFAGDPEQLSVKHAFGRLHALEQEHGSLFRGLMHALRNRDASSGGEDAGPARRMFSFRDGVQRFPEAIARTLGSSVHRNTTVTGLHAEGARWRLSAQHGTASPRTHGFDAVISTIPLHRFAALRMETTIDRTPLAEVPYPPVNVVAMGFRRADVDHPLDGFGMLVPEVEDDYQILGTIFSSTLFPDRAPDDHVLLTTFVGGARHPELGRAPKDRQQAVVKADLNALLGTRGAPSFVHYAAWPRAIPQYNLGYGAVKRCIDRLESTHPRLFLAGNYRDGVSVGSALDSGAHAAQHCVAALAPEKAEA
ncbi:MAG: protoporphyrinogen oxidase [Bacteroidetes bacterium]|jgi:oxygen-dependent protoporphyrinogen oxidase|nr:protoporphyrinogen oxidase [Bacteroidota bacterium]